jgi:hypothetical protein
MMDEAHDRHPAHQTRGPAEHPVHQAARIGLAVKRETGDAHDEHGDVDAGVAKLLQRVVAQVVGRALRMDHQVVLDHAEQIDDVLPAQREERRQPLVPVAREQPVDADDSGHDECARGNEMDQPHP